jgi:arylsulfatase A-like enzyme
MHHRSVNNGTPLDDRFTNIAREARALGYDPTLFGYTDTSVDPRTVADPDDPRLRDYEGVLPGFAVDTLLTGVHVGPWLRWMAAKGVDVPSTWRELYEPLPGHPDAVEGSRRWAPSRIAAAHTETAFLTERLLSWLDRRDDEAWFAQVSYIRPHPPYRAPLGYHDRYDPDDGPGFRRRADRDAELGQHPLHAAAAIVTGCPVDERELRALRAAYWGNMAEVDDQIGRVLDHLEATGLADSTLIVLTADHGDQMGDHWLLEKLGWWDESYHVPLIVVDPRPEADATRGRTVDQITESVDVMATLCTWLGAEVPPAVDGRPLQPFLHTHDVPEGWRTEAHWQWDFRDPVHDLPGSLFGLALEECTIDVLRGPKHKVVQFGSGDSLVFDLEADPEQLVDVASEPGSLEVIAEARGRLLSWRMRHDDRTLANAVLTRSDGLVVRRTPRG